MSEDRGVHGNDHVFVSLKAEYTDHGDQGWMGRVVGMRGVIVTWATREECVRELSKSLHIKLCYDYHLTP